MEGKRVDGAARGELSGSPARLLLDSTSTSRFRAARPVTFFVLPKKVTKERRAYKDAACGGSLRYSDEPAGVETRTISALCAEPRASNTRRPTPPARPALLSVLEGIEPLYARRALVVGALQDAEQHRGSGGSRACLSERASLQARPLPRAAEGTRAAGVLAGASFFAYFHWQDKESRGPRGPKAHGQRKKPPAACSAKALRC